MRSFLFFVVALCGSATFAQRVSVTVDGNARRQTMEGFGATTISLVFGTKDNVPAPLRVIANDLAFNQIKLNMGNLGVEPSEALASNIFAPTNDDNDPMTINAAASTGCSRTT